MILLTRLLDTHGHTPGCLGALLVASWLAYSGELAAHTAELPQSVGDRHLASVCKRDLLPEESFRVSQSC